MATEAGVDLYALARVCLGELTSLKRRIQPPRDAPPIVFASALRAVVVACCKNDDDPAGALEDVVLDEHLRLLVLAAQGKVPPQSLLEESLKLLSYLRGAGMLQQLTAMGAKNRLS